MSKLTTTKVTLPNGEEQSARRLDDREANGVWVAIPPEHQDSLRSDFPHAGPVRIMGKDISGWQLLSAAAPDFEESALRAGDLVIGRDHRIGKVPNRKRTAAW